VRTVPVDFAALFRNHFAYVWHSLRRLGVQSRDLEDVAHDVFVAVHARLDAYEPGRPLRPWLFAFACRVAADYRKAARHRVVLSEDPDFATAGGPAVDELAMAREDLDRVALALDTLDFDRRTIFILHEIDGVPVSEAARALEIRQNTAYSRLRLARKDFARALIRMDGRPSVKRGEP
jgi:RNA polymerase sigma-70 factor (ECF subfamily)